MSAYHYFASKVLIFLLSLAVRSVSRTGSVATGPMVCLAGRIKHRTHLLAKTKAKRELSLGVVHRGAGPSSAQPGPSRSQVANS